ncbi:unnamed protein product [Porites lobata]|uniref:Protein kinase domain-containing protein n=1 Tax=Porites lobata TaxID=104759 RepID=A0ABN8P2C9_9CNID|nr:unnamed protein product [Porites lobata]
MYFLNCVIYLPSLQYYFSCTLCRALLSKSISLSQCSAGNIMFPHRDIKSDNIILTEVNNMYHPMLIDFGKAILLSDAPSKQQSMTAH